MKSQQNIFFLFSTNTNIGLCSPPGLLHSVPMLLSLFSWDLFPLIKVMSCKSVFKLIFFILPNPKDLRSCQSQNYFWIQMQRWHLVWICTLWLAFSKILSLVLLPPQDSGHQGSFVASELDSHELLGPYPHCVILDGVWGGGAKNCQGTSILGVGGCYKN